MFMGMVFNMIEKIYVQVNDKRVEAKGEVLEQILKDRAESAAEQSLIEAETKAKQAKLESAKAKLAALGLDEEEIAVILGI